MDSDTTKKTFAIALTVLAAGVCIYVVWGRKAGTYKEAARDNDYWTRKVDDEDPRARANAVARLQKNPTPETVDILVRKLDDEHSPVVASAARGLARHTDRERVKERALPALIEKLGHPEDLGTPAKDGLIRAVGRIGVGSPEAVVALGKHVTRDGALAADAAWAIGKLRDPATGRMPREGEDALIGYLSSDIPKIIIGAFYGLREGGSTQRSLDALERLMATLKKNMETKGDRPLDGIIAAEILAVPLPEDPAPHQRKMAGLLMRPCQQAIKAVRARLKD